MSSECDDLIEAETTKLLKKFDGKDEELRKELSRSGLGHLPLTSQTRRMLIKKLARKCTNLVSKFEQPQHVKEDCSKEVEKSEACMSLSECSTSMDDRNKTHYVICIPGADNQILIENDRLEVLKKMKEHNKKKPRMLMFSNYDEAVAFAKKTSANDVCQGAIVKTNYPKEKAEREVNESLPFPSVGVPQLNQLRILLEKGNVNLARQLILTNPRHLISTGDVPTILKIGPRYNALHACAFTGQFESCKLIMELLGDIEFLKSMYGSQNRAEDYSKRLVDLYLNTPDKMAHKTPLHFASEKGFLEIVAFLVSFRVCNRTERHQEIACEKYHGPDKAEIKKRIQSFIQDGTCYVPLVRSDTTGPYAKVVRPFSPSSPHHLVEEIEGSLKPSHSDTSQDMKDFSNLKLWAVAGPMSPQEAQEFRRDWWSPRAGRKEIRPREPFLNITDGERGFEHYGRKLADSHDVPWQEYWPFLDAFVDMRSQEGLRKLESHLAKQSVIIKYGGFIAQGSTFPSDPLKLSKDFIMDSDKSENNEDCDSFVSASEFDTAVEEQKRVRKSQDPFEKNDLEDNDFHDCNEFLSETDSKSQQHKEQHESSFQKLWNSLGMLRDMFSPKKNTAVSDRSLSSPLSGKGTPSSSPCSSSLVDQQDNNLKKDKSEDNSLKDSLDDNLNVTESISSSKTTINQEKSSNVSRKNDPTTSSSLNPLSQDLELSAVSEISSVKPSADHDQKPSSGNESSVGTLNLSTSLKATDAPLTSTPVREWSYRNRLPIINSPDEPSSVNEEVDRIRLKEEKVQQDLEKELGFQSPDTTDSSVPRVEDDSFTRNMSLLCHGLEKFRFQSPPCVSPAETCIVDSPDSLKRIPCIHIFAETNTSKLFEEIESKLSRPDGDVKRIVLPVLMLKQASDCSEECILADLYVPVASPLRDVDSVMDETAQKEMHENVWLNFLVSFPSSLDANSITSLHGSETVDVRLVSVDAEKRNLSAREKQFDLCRLKEEFLNSRKIVTESQNNESQYPTIQCKVIRLATVLSKDVYVSGTIPTKTDGDVYRALNDETIELIDNSKDLPSVSKWLNKMKLNGKDIESLPSPACVLRSSLQRQGSLPLSPLVKSQHPAHSKKSAQSPCSSKRSGKDLVTRNLFPRN